MTRIFVAPAQERVADGARRLVANEVGAEKLQQRFSTSLRREAGRLLFVEPDVDRTRASLL